MRPRPLVQLLVALGAVLLVLQIVHSILLQRLQEMQQESTPPTGQDSSAEVLREFSDAAGSSSVVDGSGEFRILENVLSSALENSLDVALAFHASVESMMYLPETIQHWQGPVSVAVFVPAELAAAAPLLLLALRLCSAPAGAVPQLSLHVVTPVGVLLDWRVQPPDRAALCRTLQRPPPALSYRLSTAYPNNLLRSVARRGAASQLVLSLDADMVPSAELRPRLLALAARQQLWTARRLALVLPLYELAADEPPPPDKAALLLLRRRKPHRLRPFYSALCAKCQAPTNYSRWEEAPEAGPLSVLYHVPWRDPWEPVYVLHRDAPLYDERFRQFGFNRISHACELHVAGYTFAVLSDAFVLHMGLKGEAPARPGQTVELDTNRDLFRQFKRELKLKYPDSPRRC